MLKVVESKNESQQQYTTEELSAKLGIAAATLRKYNFYFGKEGITFKKERGKIVYSNDDMALFKKLMALHQRSGTTLQECIGELAQQIQPVTKLSQAQTELPQSVVEDPQPVAEHPQQELTLTPQLTELQNNVKQLETSFAKEMSEQKNYMYQQLENQQEQVKQLKSYITTKLEQRDKQMMDTIRQIQELKEEQKKGFWYWLRSLFTSKK
ncbi:MerR family transcriptional regulator [Priestia aryabhattai]|uniref:MerR family transcriptional regulator n=1 Tax=Priestia aryabhattai TaxID=412384 RepID=UPI00159BABF9|nr:MerR family transcriptional regulator [Priestia aryabhattai]